MNCDSDKWRFIHMALQAVGEQQEHIALRRFVWQERINAYAANIIGDSPSRFMTDLNERLDRLREELSK